jgi:predicted permease
LGLWPLYYATLVEEGWPYPMEALWKDLRLSLRALARSPGFTAAAVASLALGIGANTLIFTFLNALFFQSLPVAEPERLVAIYATDARNPGLEPISYPSFEDLRRAGIYADVAAYLTLPVSLTGGGDPAVVFGQMVSGNYFSLLGVKAERGRFFNPEEDATPGTHPVAVLSHGLWQSRFGADPGLVGRTIQVNSQAFHVVGIAPPEMKGLALLDRPPDLWLPAMMHGALLTGPLVQSFPARDGQMFSLVGRLKPGQGFAAGSAATAGVGHNLEKQYPAENQGIGLTALPLGETTINPKDRAKYVRSGGLLAAMVGLLLLVAGANVANLLLARALARQREIAVRLALGAGRGRLARQLLAEGALLGLLGGAAGLVVAVWGRRLLWALRPPFFPDTLDLGLHARALAFTFVVALATGLLFGLAPVLQSFQLDIATAFTEHGGGSGGARGGSFGAVLRSLLVAAQVALSLLVLAGAGLFLHSLARAESIDPGFESEKLFVIPFDLGSQHYPKPRGQQFFRDAAERAATLPGVRSAAVASRFLLAPGGQRLRIQPEGQAAARPGVKGALVAINKVGPRYFETVGIPLVTGRAFGTADRGGGPPVTVVNETLAKWLWPGEPAVGKRFRLGNSPDLLEVVGVARDADYNNLGEPSQPYAYLPVEQSYAPVMMLHVRTTGAPEPVVASARRALQGLDPGLPLLDARTIGQVRAQALWAPRMGAGLLTLFGLLAAVLATIGIYGVVAYTVGQRGREIGIRMAIGARRPDVIGLILRQGMRPVVAGLVLGLALGLAAARSIAGLLFDVTAGDPLAFAGATLLLATVALAAVYLPARRASGLDPVTALRNG